MKITLILERCRLQVWGQHRVNIDIKLYEQIKKNDGGLDGAKITNGKCHMLNGEVDFILKCVAPDLSTFQTFIIEELTSAENVASVKTSLVIRGAKSQPGVPFEVLEDRLSKLA